MAGGGGGSGVPFSPQAEQQPTSGGARRGGHRQKAAWLPLDIIILEIAARSDPATLVRCAATCRDARRLVADEDPSLLRGRLRLRGTDRFVLPLLRGHLAGISTYSGLRGENTDLYMVDTTAAAAATRLVKASFGFVKQADATVRSMAPLDSRGGLVLVRATTTTTNNTQQQQQRLVVCNPAARRCHALPPEPAFQDVPYDHAWIKAVQYVLLVGNNSDSDDGDGGGASTVGRRFQVLKANIVLSDHRPNRRLLFHTYSSSEHGGAWSPLTEIPTPNLHGIGRRSSGLQRRPLVVGGDAVHWLCLTAAGSYMLILHVPVGGTAAARVNLTALPTSFPRDGNKDSNHDYLMATATAGGNPVVLVADKDRISAWEQSRHTKMWKQRPQVVIENETILAFEDDGLTELNRGWGSKCVPEMLRFGERSGVVLLRVHGCCLLWLDLQSKKIFRSFSLDRRMQSTKVYCPYEMDLSSWVPTFSSSAIVTTD